MRAMRFVVAVVMIVSSALVRPADAATIVSTFVSVSHINADRQGAADTDNTGPSFGSTLYVETHSGTGASSAFAAVNDISDNPNYVSIGVTTNTTNGFDPSAGASYGILGTAQAQANIQDSVSIFDGLLAVQNQTLTLRFLLFASGSATTAPPIDIGSTSRLDLIPGYTSLNSTVSFSALGDGSFGTSLGGDVFDFYFPINSGVADWNLALRAISSVRFGGAEITASHTLLMTGIFLADGNTPESEGYTVTLGSGFLSPNLVSQSPATVTPEPASIALAGFAGLGMAVGAWRRRRHEKSQAA
jgi:hypothetical protein